MCAILVGGKYDIYLFQLFNLVLKNSTKEESVQSPDRFKRQLPSSISPSQRSSSNRKVFRNDLHATASKSSSRKVLFSSVQEQSQHQPKYNFLEEHINVSNLFEMNETQVKVTVVYPSGKYCYSNTSRQAIPIGMHNDKNISSFKKTINSLFLFHF